MLKTFIKGFLFTCLLAVISCTPNKDSIELIQAISNRQTEAALDLIEKGVGLDARDTLGLTPIHWAAKRALPKVTDALLQNDCDINSLDKEGYTALNYAIRANNAEATDLLRKAGAVVYKNGLSNLSDGPFVDRTEDGLYAYYLKHDSLTSKTYLTGKFLDKKINAFKGWAGDTCSYSLRESQTPNWQVKTKEPIFVLGDIHGQFDRMINNLQSHSVIDKQLKWNWGKGHLVFVGDIFDRGNKVTETLWFIYRLEQEAEKAGGQVHITFGNHELMVLNKDNRYIARDYKSLCNNLGLDYDALFHPNSVLGEWLRSKNSMTKINDILFVHGGISQKQVDSGISPDQVNQLMRQYLVAGSNPGNAEDYAQILKSFGPFWYRGYFMDRSQYKQIKEQELDEILEKLKVSHIVVGHTENEILSSSYNGKIIDVNIPLADDSIPNQALLIEDGKFYHLNESTDKVLLK
ncbi:metallophosphoesterase [Ancylomarina sp. YFZ004]